MSKENKFIELLRTAIPQSQKQINAPFSTDSELFNLAQGTYAINIDEFSKEEDYFSELVPERLAANLVAATCSDLLATGAVPEFFLHAIVADKKWDTPFFKKFIEGIKKATEHYGVILLGGDTSFSSSWRYTGVALGKRTKEISRVGLKSGDLIFSTGKLGRGNMMALGQLLLSQGKMPFTPEVIDLVSPEFLHDLDKFQKLLPFVHAAIDSSDGLLGSLLALMRVNPSVGISLHYHSGNVDAKSIVMLDRLLIPPEISLLGGAGEYEILFAVSPSLKTEFTSFLKSNHLDCPLVATVYDDRAEFSILSGLSRTFIKESELPDPRELGPESYLKELMVLHSSVKGHK